MDVRHDSIDPPGEPEAVRARYARRAGIDLGRYSPLNPAVYMSIQERERALIRWIAKAGLAPVADKRLLEVGCGAGGNLLQLIRLGFSPGNLVGSELLAERVEQARSVLPKATPIMEGNACTLDLPPESFDIVFQSTVFTSLLDGGFQTTLAKQMWRLVKPGGGVLWYDFIYDNPHNPDVKGVPVRRIRELFPAGKMTYWRVTLAPPIARVVTHLRPALYDVLNMLPFLRSHVLCWMHKDRIK
ncbi:MAG: methyltransferase domain-containing protein [Nitrospirae bacterium]|nr:methyltransferase domain-containing protein [Nitrospirota bacterium]